MKCLLPIGDARRSELASKVVHHSDAFWSILKHCYGDWRHLTPAQRRDVYAALRNGEEVITRFTDRNGIAFIVITDAARTSTVLKLANEP